MFPLNFYFKMENYLKNSFESEISSPCYWTDLAGPFKLLNGNFRCKTKETFSLMYQQLLHCPSYNFFLLFIYYISFSFYLVGGLKYILLYTQWKIIPKLRLSKIGWNISYVTHWNFNLIIISYYTNKSK